MTGEQLMQPPTTAKNGSSPPTCPQMSSNPEKELKPPQSSSVFGPHDWDYEEEGNLGPKNWQVVCTSGKGCYATLMADLKQQSPVDLCLAGKHCVKLDVGQEGEPLQFVNYGQLIYGSMVNTGHSVQFTPEARIDAPEIYGGQLDQHYRFIQYHYHWAQSDTEGSEHTLDGKNFPAELHLVHQGVEDTKKLAVLGVFLKVSEEGGDGKGVALEQDAKVLPSVREFQQQVNVQGQQLKDKLPANKQSFVRYQGSLTTPPCSENVTWTVFTEPVSVTREQLNLLRQVKDCKGCIIQRNYRPVQHLHDRSLYVCGC